MRAVVQDQRKFRTELLALESELLDKEERLRAAISTRQEFAGQLVAAQQRELAMMAENAKLVERQVRVISFVIIPVTIIARVPNTNVSCVQDRLSNDLDAERTKTSRLKETMERASAESAVDREKHFKQGFYAAKNLVSLKEEGALILYFKSIE